MGHYIPAAIAAAILAARGHGYIIVPVLAVLSSAGYLYGNRRALELSRRNAFGADSVPTLYSHFVTLLIFIALCVVSGAVLSGIFYLFR
ncbi:MAG: hypothetical protein WCF85_18215 [Rhodospirillaceae bacterium]